MTHATSLADYDLEADSVKYLPYLRYFIFGLLLPLGFAPFHLPGMAILGMALFYNALTQNYINRKTRPFLSGIIFGLGYFGLGTSWVYVSIHEYGHLYGIVAALVTLVFLLYLSLFPALVASFYTQLASKSRPISGGLLFSALWIGGEFLRANFLSGFPWLLIGFGQFDTPAKYLLPVLGVYGIGFISCFAATLLSQVSHINGAKRALLLLFFVSLLLFPMTLKNISWAQTEGAPISVGVVQVNLSMRDKWDETMFWDLLHRYDKEINKLLGTQLIVLPESAIPLPTVYLTEFLHALQEKAKKAGSAILLGIPHPTSNDEALFYNALISLGNAKGSYFKQHLVPFGEYFPEVFQTASAWLGLPDANSRAGRNNQPLVTVGNYSIASLICYELAYGDLLRQQLPEAKYIVSISDDGWFGHSFAMYQQLQMAQVMAVQAARFHVVSNNDGLSSVIDEKGDIVSSLPAYSSGILQSHIYALSGMTPWVKLGNWPILLFSMIIILYFVMYKRIHDKS